MERGIAGGFLGLCQSLWKIRHIIDRNDAAIRFFNLPYEIDLVVVDVLAEFTTARDHNRCIARRHRLDEGARPPMRDYDGSVPHQLLHLLGWHECGI